VNCAALPDTLFESEIFGYEKGAFTGAHDRKPGRLELANNGTLFLDEIGDMSLIAQAKLLRVLEERRFERLGGNTSIEVNFRLISATNRPLDAFVRETRFREDLYYRVNAFSIRLPVAPRAIERHPGPRAALPRALLRANGLPPRRKSFAKEATDLLMQYSLAGQHPRAREHVSRAALSSPGPGHQPADIEFLHASRRRPRPHAIGCPSWPTPNGAHIARVLESVNWNKKQAAAVLEISRGTLYRKIVEYGLEERRRRLETEQPSETRDFGTRPAYYPKGLSASFAIAVSKRHTLCTRSQSAFGGRQVTP
jgi:transcriptional regulator with PAS, ATPase and Fis domain